MDRLKTCDRCKYWWPSWPCGAMPSEGKQPGASKSAPCCRFPPQITTGGYSEWPVVYDKATCGEFMPGVNREPKS